MLKQDSTRILIWIIHNFNKNKTNEKANYYNQSLYR